MLYNILQTFEGRKTVMLLQWLNNKHEADYWLWYYQESTRAKEINKGRVANGYKPIPRKAYKIITR